jgi:BirA family biotin operon repressor/biotin-[acetyl-CoA-carboxylase] ligase
MAELGHKVSRVEFTGLLLESIETWYNAFLVQGAIPVVQKWESLARIRGEFLEVKSFGELYQGVAEGLDHDGALLLRKGNGERMRVVAGDVTKVSVQPPGFRGQGTVPR